MSRPCAESSSLPITVFQHGDIDGSNGINTRIHSGGLGGSDHPNTRVHSGGLAGEARALLLPGFSFIEEREEGAVSPDPPNEFGG